MVALIGRKVINKWRDLGSDGYKGTIVAVDAGCNPTVWVKFDGRNFRSPMCANDLAFYGQYPRAGCQVVVDQL